MIGSKPSSEGPGWHWELDSESGWYKQPDLNKPKFFITANLDGYGKVTIPTTTSGTVTLSSGGIGKATIKINPDVHSLAHAKSKLSIHKSWPDHLWHAEQVTLHWNKPKYGVRRGSTGSYLRRDPSPKNTYGEILVFGSEKEAADWAIELNNLEGNAPQ